METLFGTVEDPERAKKGYYSDGFVKAYDSYGHPADKARAYKEWVKQDLDHDWERIADRAWVYHCYCVKTGQWQALFRTWLHNHRWDDVLPNEQVRFKTVEEAYKSFKKGDWNWCGETDCTNLVLTRNSKGLYLGDLKAVWAQDVSRTMFYWRPSRSKASVADPVVEASDTAPVVPEAPHKPMSAEEKAAKLAEFRRLARQERNPMLGGVG